MSTPGWTAAPPHGQQPWTDQHTQQHAGQPHEEHRFRRIARRVPRPVRLLLGMLLLLAGIAMLVLPGPGLLVMFIGLQVLALDIPVAARAERAVLRRLRAAAHKAKARRRSH